MRTLALACLFSLASIICFGQKVRFGLTGSPLITWMKADASEIKKGKIRAGVEYGLLLDIEFAQNYALSTGLTISHLGGNLKYTDSLLFKNTMDERFINDTKARFKLQYINLPVVFKLKTNEIGYFTYYGSFGLIASFRVKARVDATVNGEKIFENENIVKKKDETDGVFKSNLFNIGLHVGGGLEYKLNDKTALLAGIFFNNGFLNVVEDGDDGDKILVHNFGLRIGIMF